MKPEDPMYLNLKETGRPMRLVYDLRVRHEADPGYVAAVQALTLNPDKPLWGLKGTHGLYGSEAWWESIRAGRIRTEVVSGTIAGLFFAGQGSRWGNQVNSFRLRLEDGSLIEESIYAQHKRDRKLFAVGATVCVVYVLDEMKQPVRDGSTDYSRSVLEMAVSLAR